MKPPMCICGWNAVQAMIASGVRKYIKWLADYLLSNILFIHLRGLRLAAKTTKPHLKSIANDPRRRFNCQRITTNNNKYQAITHQFACFHLIGACLLLPIQSNSTGSIQSKVKFTPRYLYEGQHQAQMESGLQPICMAISGAVLYLIAQLKNQMATWASSDAISNRGLLCDSGHW